MTGSSKGAVLKLIADLGPPCQKYQDEHLRNLPCQRLQADEVWSFCYSKQKNIPERMIGKFGVGDVWTWTAIDADTKLIPCWYVGSRSGAAAYRFMTDLAGRLANRVQLTTDGHRAYLNAVDAAFDRDIDYAMLVKIYGDAPESEKRYSPADCLGADKTVIRGRPDPEHISTSYVERQNLTMRMSMRRFTRLTNGFSKKIDNHKYMLAIYFMYYNFGRVHQTLRVTPAMQAGVSDHIWTSQEICNLDSK